MVGFQQVKRIIEFFFCSRIGTIVDFAGEDDILSEVSQSFTKIFPGGAIKRSSIEVIDAKIQGFVY